MGGGGKGQPSTDWNQVAGQNAYNAAASGQSWEQVAAGQGGDPTYMAALQQGFNSYQPAPAFEMPSFEGFGESSSGSDYAAAVEEAEANRLAEEEERKRIEGENERDQMYSNYMTAAGSATDFVNSEIMQEEANARLLGIDYTMTDEMKSTRISDYFASIWGEGEQASLEASMSQWGAPEGFGGFTVQRGDASSYAGTEGSEEVVAESKGVKPKTLATEEEDALGGNQTILGGAV